MCPSYQVTREEEHSTRGRARLLFEMLDGHGDSPGHRRLAVDRGQETPSTCAWPARAARATARPTSTWPPTRRSSSPTTTQGRRGAARAPTTPSAGCPRRPRGLAGSRLAPVVNALTQVPAAAHGRHQTRRARRPRESRCSPPQTLQLVQIAAAPAATATAAPCCSGRTRSPTTSIRTSARPRSRCSRRPAGGSSCPPSRSAAA